MIRSELIGLLRCPETGETLEGWDGAAPDAVLIAPSTGRRYPVTGGIPCLLPDALREEPAAARQADPAPSEEFEQKRREIAARDDQVVMYDHNLPLRLFSVPEIPITLHYLAPEPKHLMLEAGCGTGRMSRHFAERVRGIVCADISAESLRVARSKMPPELAEKTLFIQADLSHLPLASDAFDRVGSFQVLEHIPTPGARSRAIAEMSRVLKPRTEGGRLALSAYRWGAPLSWSSAKEGYHDGGIYFYRSTWEEMSALLEPHLAVGAHTGALLYHHLLWARRKQGL